VTTPPANQHRELVRRGFAAVLAESLWLSVNAFRLFLRLCLGRRSREILGELDRKGAAFPQGQRQSRDEGKV